MVTYKVERIRSDSLRRDQTLGRLAVVGKFEQVKHVLMLLLENSFPGVLRNGCQLTANSMMPCRKVITRQHWIGARDRSGHVVRRRREGLRLEDLMRFSFFVRVVLPLHITVKIINNLSRYCPIEGHTYPFQPFRSAANSFFRSPTASIAA